jgi:hypothetical protein
VNPIHFSTFALAVALTASFAPAAGAQATTSPPAPFSGPLDLRNQWTFQLAFLDFAPQSGQTLRAGDERTTVALDIANDLFIPASGPNGVHVDTETQRLDYSLRHGVGRDLEWQVEVPIEWRDGGLLDPLVETYHRFVGFDQPSEDDIIGRKNIGDFHSVIDVTDPLGRTLYDTGTAFGVGDTTLALKQGLGRPGRLDAAVRVGAKLPTGNAEDLIGSGAVDYGGDIDLDYRASSRLTIDTDGSVARIGRPTHIGLLQANNTMDHLMIAIEYRVDGRTEWILQNDQSGVGIVTGDAFADGVQSGIAVGFRRQWGARRAFYAAFTENGDIANYDAPWLAYNGPDVTVSAGIDIAR